MKVQKANVWYSTDKINTFMKKIIFVFLILSLFSCKKTQKNEMPEKSNDILSIEQMSSVLVDVHLIEATLITKQNNGQDVKYYTKYYYSYLTKKHNITYDQFKYNINYYSSHIKEFEKIYEQVVNTISQKNGEIYKK
jgi:hypothetical protein